MPKLLFNILGGCSVSSKPWMEELKLEVSSKAAYERVKLKELVPWLGEPNDEQNLLAFGF